MTNIFNKILGKILDNLKPFIEERVHDLIQREIKTDKLVMVSDDIFHETIEKAMDKSITQEVKDAFKEVTVGVLQECKHWSFKLAASGIDLVKVGNEVTTCSKEFCKNFNMILEG